MAKKPQNAKLQPTRTGLQVEAIADFMSALDYLNRAAAYAYTVGVKAKVTDSSSHDLHLGIVPTSQIPNLSPTFYVFNSKESK